MRNPSDFLSPDLARRLRGNLGLVALGLLTLALGEPMRTHAEALLTLAAPHGILSLQFTCTADAAQRILDSWDGVAMDHARSSLLWDSGFAPAYGIALLALTERLVTLSRHGGSWLSVLAWLPFWAASADLAENLLHYRLLDGGALGSMAMLPTLACGFALFKWGVLALWSVALVGLGLGFLVNRMTRT